MPTAEVPEQAARHWLSTMVRLVVLAGFAVVAYLLLSAGAAQAGDKPGLPDLEQVVRQTDAKVVKRVTKPATRTVDRVTKPVERVTKPVAKTVKRVTKTAEQVTEPVLREPIKRAAKPVKRATKPAERIAAPVKRVVEPAAAPVAAAPVAERPVTATPPIALHVAAQPPAPEEQVTPAVGQHQATAVTDAPPPAPADDPARFGGRTPWVSSGADTASQTWALTSAACLPVPARAGTGAATSTHHLGRCPGSAAPPG